MSISFIGSESTLGGSVAKPAGTSTGDFMLTLLIRHVGEDLEEPHSPGGWTQIDQSPVMASSHGTGPRMWGYFRYAQSSEPDEYDWTTIDANLYEFETILIVYRGLDDNGIAEVTKADADPSLVLTLEVPAVTTVAANSLLMAVGAYQLGATNITFDDYTEREIGTGHGVADKVLATAGESDPLTLTFTSTTGWKMGFHIALTSLEVAAGFRDYCESVNLDLA